jgi:hypothetical protein
LPTDGRSLNNIFTSSLATFWIIWLFSNTQLKCREYLYCELLENVPTVIQGFSVWHSVNCNSQYWKTFVCNFVDNFDNVCLQLSNMGNPCKYYIVLLGQITQIVSLHGWWFNLRISEYYEEAFNRLSLERHRGYI